MCDGFTSASIIYNYLYKNYKDWAIENLEFLMHDGKQHGINDMIGRIDYDNIGGIIVPDAGSNDIEAMRQIVNNTTYSDIFIDILDHHTISCDITKAPPQATIVNVQNCDYPNKALTGAGVAYKFIQCYEDTFLDGKNVDYWMDLAAIGDCGDMAQYTEYEIRSLVYNGLKKLRNPFYKGLAEVHDYSIQKMNGLNYYSCAFYIVPFVNALCRSGMMEEKEFCFKASLERYAYQEVESGKRGHKGEKVEWWEEAITIAERVKRRQTKVQDELMDVCEKKIEEQHLNDDKIIFVRLNPGEGVANLNG